MPSPASPQLGTPSAPTMAAPWAAGSVAPAGADGPVRDVTAPPGPPSGREPDLVAGALAAAALRIECGREGFARARAFTRRTLSDWSLDHCGDDAAVVVTELAANAATHAVPFAPEGRTDVWLGLALDGAHLLLTVSDPCGSRPVPARPAGPGLAEHGRGLGIVEALAEEWGWTPRPPQGKTVWARLPTSPPH
ncbi:ATP-binding protein [Streptomyces sp. MK5]|uniref:ATP-binding protein n=1 Tax=Streptomyces sp. MK5 TaxID=3064253 RepID=UPI002740CF87|nr:ATP-binding protein [Streptomyces sp. MK5]